MLGAALAAVCLTTSASAASSAPTAKPGQIVIVASGQTHGTLIIKHTTELATVNWSRTLPSGTVSSASPYIGIQISQGRNVEFGFYVDRALADAVIFGPEHPRLAAGRYDVTVVSSRSAIIRIPINGSSRYTLKLNQHGTSARAEANAALTSGAPTDFASLSTRVTKTTTALLMLTTTATAENASNNDLCLTTRQLPCTVGSSDSGNGQESAIINTAASHNQAVLYVYPGNVPPGDYYATADQQVVGVQQSATFIVVTFDA